MAKVEMPPEHITDYERAVCYYTLPRVTHPVTLGLIAAYAVCLFETLAAVAYGLIWDNLTVTRFGLWAFAGMVVFGIVAFIGRALVQEVRRRSLLAVARNTPDAAADTPLPDPFAGHMLLRHPLHSGGDIFPCTDDRGTISYFVHASPDRSSWRISDSEDSEILRVHVDASTTSFAFAADLPSRLSVWQGDQAIARIRRAFSLTDPTVYVECLGPGDRREYRIRKGGVYRDKRLVGRLYFLHKSVYLDIEEAEMNKALLGVFVVMG